MSSIVDSINIRGRVIRALILREVATRYGNSQLGFFWALFEPTAFILVFILIFGFIGRSSPLPGDLYTFFLSGMLPFLFFRSISNRVGNSESANKALLTYPQVTTLDIKIARFIIEFLVTIFVSALTYFAMVRLKLILVPIDEPLNLILCFTSVAIFSFAFGLVIAAIIAYWPNFQNLFQAIFARPLFLLSGIFFIPEQLPHPYSDWIAMNPLAQFIAWARSAIYPNFDSVYGFNWQLIFITFTFLAVGLALERITLRKKLSG